MGYVDEFYTSGGGTAWRGAAATVAVTDGMDTSGIGFSLATGAGSISGTVERDSDSTGIQDVVVTVNTYSYWLGTPNYSDVAWVNTDSDGNYNIAGIAPGAYYLKTSNSQGYADEYYDNIEYPTFAYSVNITSGVDREDTDFSLAIGGSISGRITRDSDGAGMSGVRVIAYRNVGFIDLFTADTFYADSEGYYTITGLAEGYYYVYPESRFVGYFEEFYENSNVYDPIGVPVTWGNSTPT